jgi:hypothetical protein
MTLGYGIAAFFGGWCGSVPLALIIWWLLGKKGGPPPPPPPDGWRGDWLISKVIGAVAGVITAYVYGAAFGIPTPQPAIGSLLEATVFSFVGFLGGRFASELYEFARGGGSRSVSAN